MFSEGKAEKMRLAELSRILPHGSRCLRRLAEGLMAGESPGFNWRVRRIPSLRRRRWKFQAERATGLLRRAEAAVLL